MSPDAVAVLRVRLVTLRADAMAQLAAADVLDAGMIGLVGSVGAALDTLNAVPGDAEPAERAVVSDDGRGVQLVLYSGAEASGTVALDPVRCVVLAQRLLESAARRL